MIHNCSVRKLAAFIAMLIAAVSVHAAADIYMSSSFGINGGFTVPYTFSTDDMEAEAAPELLFRFGSNVEPDITVYGVVGASGGPIFQLTGLTTPMPYSAGVTLGVGAAFRMDGNGRWSLGVEGAFIGQYDSRGDLRLGGSVSFIPEYAFAVAREWFSWSLIIPLTLTFTGTQMNARLGIGFMFELDDYVIDYAW